MWLDLIHFEFNFNYISIKITNVFAKHATQCFAMLWQTAIREHFGMSFRSSDAFQNSDDLAMLLQLEVLVARASPEHV